jgi:hypothetical protein
MNVVFDVMRYISINLPVLLRKTKMAAWLMALTHPIKIILAELQVYRDAQVELLKYNGEIMVLTSLCQQKCPSFVYFQNLNQIPQPITRIGNRTTNKYLVRIGARNQNYRILIGSRTTGNEYTGYDFIAYTDYMAVESIEYYTLISFINRYKAYGSRYIVQDYTTGLIIYQS